MKDRNIRISATSTPEEIDKLINQFIENAATPRQAIDDLFKLVYHELRAIGSNLLRAEASRHTLQTTALVHEAYLRLIKPRTTQLENRAHFFGIAARAMRQVLVDEARKRLSQKRGGQWQRVTLDDQIGFAVSDDVRILDLDAALTRFAAESERMAQVAELRIFAGMKSDDIALALNVSIRTVQGDWRLAKMWLTRELTEGPGS